MSSRKNLVDVWDVHLEAVLVLVSALVHVLEVAGLVEGGRRSSIDSEIAQWRAIVGTLGQGGLFQVVVVRGTKEEDSLAEAGLDISLLDR